MLYLKCPTCKELLGNRVLIYETQLKKINNLDVKEASKEILRHKLLSDLVELYCCKQRLITYKNIVETVK